MPEQLALSHYKRPESNEKRLNLAGGRTELLCDTFSGDRFHIRMLRYADDSKTDVSYRHVSI